MSEIKNNLLPHDQQNENKEHWTRRRFLKALLQTTAVVGVAGAGFAASREDMAPLINFVLDRRKITEAEGFFPEEADFVLSREAADRIFENLDLENECGDLLNKDAWFLVSQRVARLAGLYFEADVEKDYDENRAGFETHCENVFGMIRDISKEMKVDFVGVMLTWQVSGANTSSQKSLKNDERDEWVRAITNAGERLTGYSGPMFLVNVLRTFGVDGYYAMARLLGPPSLGIHDIETVMIARGLVNLRETNTKSWVLVQEKLKQKSPVFLEKMEELIDNYNIYDNYLSESVFTIKSDLELIKLAKELNNSEIIKQVIGEGNSLDAYQILHTTTSWAILCEEQALHGGFGHYPVDGAKLESLVLEKAVCEYLESETGLEFVFDQLGNPKFIEVLEKAYSFDKAARRLLAIGAEIKQLGSNVIKKEWEIAAVIESEGLERDLEFQLTTGVAYSRWILNEARKRERGEYSLEISYSDPNKVAYESFLATGLREAAPTFLLAGKKPLHEANLTFLSGDELFSHLDMFVKEVYLKDSQLVHPREEFRNFVLRLAEILESFFTKTAMGVEMMKLRKDKSGMIFLQRAEEFGVRRRLMSLPHSSWMRSVEATAAYISEMSE